MELVKLHDVPDLTEECLRIINDEWPRSNGQRLRTLSTSCDGLPIDLVLITKSPEMKVLGHSRIKKVPHSDTGLYVETVVIDKPERGKGYGRILMNKTEEVIKKLGFETSFLITTDKEAFYTKLGYSECPPIRLYGGSLLKDIFPSQVSPSKSVQGTSANIPAPPPPPPQTVTKSKTQSVLNQKSVRNHMFKKL